MDVVNGSADVTTYFVLRDSTNHVPKTDITITDIDLYYLEQGAAMAAKVDATALDAADSAHADNKAYHCGQGLYRIDWPDEAFNGGVGKKVELIVVCTGVDTTFLEVELKDPWQTGDSYAIVNHADYGNAKLVRSTTPENTLSVDASHLVAVPDTQKVDLETVKTKAITCADAITVLASVGTAATSTAQTGDSFDKVNDATIGLANLKALIDAMQADIGDASASTLGSLYAILGNATAAIAGRLPAALESGNMPVHVKAQDNIDFGALQKASITAAVPTASAIGTDAASKVLVTPAQKLVTDANGYVTYSNAAPPSADDVRAAMESDGSKLDHLWEMTEDDGGIRRLTTNALEQAPTGGSAPSAASIADAVWDEAIADHTTATTFGGKNQKGVPSETVNDYKATGFSTHTAADVKTAMEAVGSHLALIKTAAEAIDTLTKASGSGDLARALVILEKIYKSAATIVEGAAAVGTLSTTEMTTTLTEATDDHYNGRVIIFSSGVLANQATDITDYDGATKKLTFTAVTEAPTAADTFVIV